MAKSRLSLQIIDPEKARVIRLQADLVRDEGFFLAGGVGLAVRLGHRLSADLDWFTPRPFDVGAIERHLEALAESPTQILRHGRHTVRAYYGTLETSFITYGQVPASPEIMRVAGTEIPVADIAIIAAMKAAALHDRGAKRDFIDIHAICSQPGWSVERFIKHAAQLLPLQPEQVARALTYFIDAEKDPMPAGYVVAWAKVKTDLARGVQQWEQGSRKSRRPG
jgi:hypothetical protein